MLTRIKTRTAHIDFEARTSLRNPEEIPRQVKRGQVLNPKTIGKKPSCSILTTGWRVGEALVGHEPRSPVIRKG
jgi:hypothetical protein